MKITYGTSVLDLDTINSPDDAVLFAQTIEGQKDCLFAKKKEKPVDKENLLFDECTEKETALRNLSYTLEQEHLRIKNEMFPASVGNLIYLAKQNGNADMVNIPAVNTEDYANLQKIAYLKRFVDDYVMFLVQARVGFGLSLSIGNNGHIYALKDLRELHSKALY